jgi:pimeloyl-ACP methyl ester carboxylesterase
MTERSPATPGPAPAARGAVLDSVLALPARYLPDRAPPDPRHYRLRLGDAGTFTILALKGRCIVGPGAVHARGGPAGIGRAHAELVTDGDAWLAIANGTATGFDLFLEGRLQVRGDLNEALRLETLFAPPAGTPAAAVHASLVRYRVPGAEVEALEAGAPDAPAVLLLHGLGASKVSLLPVIAGLAPRHRVVAIDFPGFGKSSAPLAARYDPAWFAAHVEGLLDAAGIARAAVVGNSLGGRVALELALRVPHRVAALGLLCPAVAFDEYSLLRPLLAASRADMAVSLPSWPFPPQLVDLGLRLLFDDHTRVPEQNLAAARDDFLRSLRPRRNRMAFMAVARQLAMEQPGRFWPRLAALGVPSLWVFGSRDRLVNPAYAHVVRARAAGATVEVWPNCGHVPQFEYPRRTVDRLLDFLAAAKGQAVSRARSSSAEVTGRSQAKSRQT